MKFREFVETYSSNLGYLKSYLKDKPLDLPSNMWYFLQWPGSSVVLKRLRISKKRLEAEQELGSDIFYDLCDRIEKAMTPDEREAVISIIMRQNPAEAPTWASMDMKRIVRRTTWLVHFTDDPDGVKYHGFTKGTEDITKLALTTHLGDFHKQHGGYNFAFIADSRAAANAERNEKYGHHAVMFRAAGVLAYHYGDEEDQVVFYGPHVQKQEIIVLRNAGEGWCVEPSHSNRSCLYQGEFQNAVDWVMTNYEQYRRVM